MNKRIKIVYVIGQLAVGGTELQLLELIKRLDQSIFEIHVICLSGGETELVNKYIQAGVALFLLGREKWGRCITIWKMFQIVKNLDPDIVHSFSYAGRAGVFVAKLIGRSMTVISFRNDPQLWVSFWDRLLFNRVDLILENSNYALISYKTLNGGKIPPAKVVFNGIDLNEFDSSRKKEILKAVPPQLVSNNMVICMVSRLVDQKHVDDLIRAYSLLLKDRPDVELWIIGDGVLRKHLEGLSINQKKQDKVYFWGMRFDVPSILRYVDICVHTSEYEGLPNSVIEYMASTLPVVATNVRGTNELVIDQETGLLVPFGDCQSIADAILYLLENREVAKKLGEAGRRRVEDHFSMVHMVRQTTIAYMELCSKGRH